MKKKKEEYVMMCNGVELEMKISKSWGKGTLGSIPRIMTLLEWNGVFKMKNNVKIEVKKTFVAKSHNQRKGIDCLKIFVLNVRECNAKFFWKVHQIISFLKNTWIEENSKVRS